MPNRYGIAVSRYLLLQKYNWKKISCAALNRRIDLEAVTT